MVASEAKTETGAGTGSPSANGWFQLDVPADGARVTVKKLVRHAGDGRPVELADILQSGQVTHGILRENIRAVLRRQGDTPGIVRDVLVAKGEKAIHGVDACLLVDDSLAVGRVLDNGRIDFHERSYPWNIRDGEIVGRVRPAIPEKNGFTVIGKVIPATPAEGLDLRLEGLTQEEDGSLRALRDGVLLVDGPRIAVSDSLLVKTHGGTAKAGRDRPHGEKSSRGDSPACLSRRRDPDPR